MTASLLHIFNIHSGPEVEFSDQENASELIMTSGVVRYVPASDMYKCYSSATHESLFLAIPGISSVALNRGLWRWLHSSGGTRSKLRSCMVDTARKQVLAVVE